MSFSRRFKIRKKFAEIYKKTADNKARFVLGNKGQKTLVIFGVNPSTADDTKLDPTVTRVVRYAQKNGFDGWLMFNLYAQRATNPKNMSISPNVNYLHENLDAVDEYINRGDLIWAAWGNIILSRTYLLDCLEDIHRKLKAKNAQWKTIGLTKKGHPRHPLMMSYKVDLVDFDIDNYIHQVTRLNKKCI